MEEIIEEEQFELQEKVVYINRVAKVVKGGRRFSLTALVVVGNQNGLVGIGQGKGKEVPIAIQKGIQKAKKDMIEAPIIGTTIPHQTIGQYGAGKVLLKPASPGTGIIAGGPVRAVLELAGIKDVLTKSLGSSNPVNMVKATMEGLKGMLTIKDVAAKRGKTVEELIDNRER